MANEAAAIAAGESASEAQQQQQQLGLPAVNAGDTSAAKEDHLKAQLEELLKFYTAPSEGAWPQSSFMRVRGVLVHYKDTDPGGLQTRGQPCFVLLHGFAGSTASFDEVFGELSRHGRVVSFDRPAFGLTERVLPQEGVPWQLSARTLGENPYTAKFAAKLMFGILDRLGVDECVLVSHSLGAQVALRAIQLRPQAVRAAVLTAPAVLNPLDARFSMGRDNGGSIFSPIANLRTRLSVAAQASAAGLALMTSPTDVAVDMVRNVTLSEDLESRVRRNFHDPALVRERPELVGKYVTPLREDGWDRGLLEFYRAQASEAAPGSRLLEEVRAVWKGPVLVIAGETDPTVPLSACQFVAERFDARLRVIEQCAHIPMDEVPEAWTRAVVSFVDSSDVLARVRPPLPWRQRRLLRRQGSAPQQPQQQQQQVLQQRGAQPLGAQQQQQQQRAAPRHVQQHALRQPQQPSPLQQQQQQQQEEQGHLQ